MEATRLTLAVLPDGKDVVDIGIAGASTPFKKKTSDNQWQQNYVVIRWAAKKAITLLFPACSLHMLTQSCKLHVHYGKTGSRSLPSSAYVAKKISTLPTFLWRLSAITKKARRPMFIL